MRGRERNYGITRVQDLAISQNGKYEYGYDILNWQILPSRDEHRNTYNNKWLVFLIKMNASRFFD